MSSIAEKTVGRMAARVVGRNDLWARDRGLSAGLRKHPPACEKMEASEGFKIERFAGRTKKKTNDVEAYGSVLKKRVRCSNTGRYEVLGPCS